MKKHWHDLKINGEVLLLGKGRSLKRLDFDGTIIALNHSIELYDKVDYLFFQDEWLHSGVFDKRQFIKSQLHKIRKGIITRLNNQEHDFGVDTFYVQYNLDVAAGHHKLFLDKPDDPCSSSAGMAGIILNHFKPSKVYLCGFDGGWLLHDAMDKHEICSLDPNPYDKHNEGLYAKLEDANIIYQKIT